MAPVSSQPARRVELQSLGGLVVGNHNDHGLLGGAGEQRKVKRAGSIGESGHTSAPDTEGEVPANAIKRGGLLQFREYFADKREDHAVPVYQRLRDCASSESRFAALKVCGNALV